MYRQISPLSLLLPLIASAPIHDLRLGKYNPERLYHYVFEPSDSVWDYGTIVDALHRLYGVFGLNDEDPRRSQVYYWVEAAENNASKCTLEAHQEMVSRLNNDKAQADKTNEGLLHSSTINLERYAGRVMSDRFSYCQTEIGPKLSESISFLLGQDLNSLTADGRKELALLSNEFLAERITQLLKGKFQQSSGFKQFAREADHKSVRLSYDKVSPCPKLLKVIQRYDSFYKLLTLAPNEILHSDMKYIVNVASVCEYLLNSKRVFELAADQMRKMS